MTLADSADDATGADRLRRPRPGEARALLGRRARRPGYAIPGPPDGFADWPAFLAANGVPEQDWGAGFALEAPDQPRIFFQRVPETKAAKNRVHLDLQAGGGRDVPLDERRAWVAAEVERLERLGATRLGEYTDPGAHWVVMTDPEGNEFCV